MWTASCSITVQLLTLLLAAAVHYYVSFTYCTTFPRAPEESTPLSSLLPARFCANLQSGNADKPGPTVRNDHSKGPLPVHPPRGPGQRQ
ncbi:hypothetical protein BJ166DRAFT_153003 [Pestalotiopsis sp. NC0098]|nr:hypothetical protein BJ166DRAFT_153003 [Pestalotiopsis sp. NC0098]